MPMLPSGRHIAVSTGRVTDLARRGHAAVPDHPLSRVRTLDDLRCFIDVLYYRPRWRARGWEGTYDCRSDRPPENLESYVSGHTLASLEAVLEEWPDEDVVAFRTFVARAGWQEQMQETLDLVLRAQHGPTPEERTSFAEAMKRVTDSPLIRHLYLDASDDL